MEDFVTYEQAVKLKELGFKYPCNHYYSLDSGLLHEETENDQTNYIHCNSKYLISAPTMSQAVKWLREVKGVKVYVKPLFSSEEYEYWISFKFRGYGGDEDYGVKDSWENALSAGIDQAFKLLKEEIK